MLRLWIHIQIMKLIYDYILLLYFLHHSVLINLCNCTSSITMYANLDVGINFDRFTKSYDLVCFVSFIGCSADYLK